MPYIPSRGDTARGADNVLTIGGVLASVVAVFILFSSVVFKSDQKSTDLAMTQPSTESPTTGDTKTP